MSSVRCFLFLTYCNVVFISYYIYIHIYIIIPKIYCHNFCCNQLFVKEIFLKCILCYPHFLRFCCFYLLCCISFIDLFEFTLDIIPFSLLFLRGHTAKDIFSSFWSSEMCSFDFSFEIYFPWI